MPPRKAAKRAAKKPPTVKFETASGARISAKAAADDGAKDRAGKHKKKSKDKHREAVSDDAVKLVRKLLAAAGCKLWEVEADGNCLFRAISDQLYGDQNLHLEIRKRIVDFIEEKRDDFEPFMEDEEKFDHYCTRMREDGTWGGNQELYAAARLFQVYIVVHMESSRMVIECDAAKPKRILHVAYHGSDHYDSVRSLKESDEQAHSGTPPMEIELDCDGFRPDDLAKRWQSREGDQRITASVGSEDEADSSLADQLQDLRVSAESGKPLSKKAQRQLRKQEAASKRSAKLKKKKPE